MSIEIEVDEQLLAESAAASFREHSQAFNELNRVSLSSQCDIVWQLDGVPHEIRIQANRLAALCLCFNGTLHEDWFVTVTGGLLTVPDKGELFIEEPGLDAIGDHLNLLNNAFGSTEPDPDDEGAFNVLDGYVFDEYVRSMWHDYVGRLAKVRSDFCEPLYHTSERSILRSRLEAQARQDLHTLMDTFIRRSETEEVA